MLPYLWTVLALSSPYIVLWSRFTYDTVKFLLKSFDDIIGLDRLKVFHINGSLNKCGAHKDRHANIGAGETNPKGADNIGFEAISRIVHHPKTQGRPFILETPWISKTENLYKQEIAMLRGEEK